MMMLDFLLLLGYAACFALPSAISVHTGGHALNPAFRMHCHGYWTECRSSRKGAIASKMACAARSKYLDLIGDGLSTGHLPHWSACCRLECHSFVACPDILPHLLLAHTAHGTCYTNGKNLLALDLTPETCAATLVISA